ncbi:class I SAM-dependent methyltransferase [Celeribacter sp. SCSIO 80788]|jgi:2-polyprenyl-3-methyl-5-hydroxy-6-metoxy-1,4-benzoquinol methylase|uniref:class I SAM-dependent methyltransferase n=1 Tax=Celeribacter sp. SCSIO 80788 TaxID=3117013 RepID=UPI003DA487A5
MTMTDIPLPPVTDPLLKLLREYYGYKYVELHGRNSGKGFYTQHDWRRIQYGIELLDPDSRSILDVGVGPSALLNYLQLGKHYETVTGIDLRRYSKQILVDEQTDFRVMDATALSFETDSYDTVVCMEVLEHIPGDAMFTALEELRRVAKKQLIVSVPFDEPQPLPPYHHQYFDAARIAEVFPKAEIHVLQRPHRKGWPWAIAIETF